MFFLSLASWIVGPRGLLINVVWSGVDQWVVAVVCRCYCSNALTLGREQKQVGRKGGKEIQGERESENEGVIRERRGRK